MKNIRILLLSSIFLFLCACQNDLITHVVDNVRVLGYLENVSRTTFISNGSVTDTHWVKNDSIGLFTLTDVNVLYTALNSGKNAEFISQSNGLDFVENKMVTAYYPYTDSIKDNYIRLPVTTKFNSSNLPISFMYGKSIVSNNKLNFQFKHLYAYLQLKISIKLFADNIFSSLPEGYYKKEGICLYITSSENISTSEA